MPRGGLLVPAIIAMALIWAPSSVSAASNELTQASVSPATGSVTTVFTFGVRYDGKFPATSVRVEVAGLSLPMVLGSGTGAAGTWSLGTLLPAGSWPVSFVAATTRGGAPRVDGLVVTVSGPGATSAPTPDSGGQQPDTPTGPGTPSPTGGAPAPIASGAAEPDATDSPASAPPHGGPGASGGTGGPGDPVDPGGSGGQSPADDPGAGAPPGGPVSPSTPASRPSDGSDGSPRESSSAAGGGEPDPRARPSSAEDSLLASVLGVGLVGIASIGIVGSAILVAGRRRDEEDDPLMTDPVAAATDALDRRALRQARRRLDDEDPIVAALGAGPDAEPARRPRRFMRQVNHGPGERDGRTPPT